MVAECTGTVLCDRNSRTELRPSRSSNQPESAFCLIPGADIEVPQARLEITTSSPRTLTAYSSSGAGGGPDTTLPLRSYTPLWQAHQICCVASRNCTVQLRCVQTAEKAFQSFSPDR